MRVIRYIYIYHTQTLQYDKIISQSSYDVILLYLLNLSVYVYLRKHQQNRSLI